MANTDRIGGAHDELRSIGGGVQDFAKNEMQEKQEIARNLS